MRFELLKTSRSARGWSCDGLREPQTVCPELVEGLSFFGCDGAEEGQGFDKLSPNGIYYGCRRMIGLHHYIAVSATLFVLGVLGIFINRKNLIVILMSIELILLSVNINLVAFSAFLGDLVGQVFAMFVLTVAAGEAAIGLAILVIYFRGRATISVDDVNRMRG
jgi:NADH-quinone oxidoreductase subunit K